MAWRALGVLCVVGCIALSLGCAGLDGAEDLSADVSRDTTPSVVLAEPSQPTPRATTPLTPEPLLIDHNAALAEFCSKAASEQYAVGYIVHPLELRTWVLQAVADKEPYVARGIADRYSERLAPVNPYLAYSFYHVYRGDVPTDTEVLAWFPAFVRAVVTPESSEAPGYLRVPSSFKEMREFLNMILTQRNKNGELLFRVCLKSVNSLEQYFLFSDVLKVISLNVMAPYFIQGHLNVLSRLYDEYALASLNGQTPPGMSYIEYLATYASGYLKDQYPRVDWERVREEWAAERESATP